jgi:hypothetical protein
MTSIAKTTREVSEETLKTKEDIEEVINNKQEATEAIHKMIEIFEETTKSKTIESFRMTEMITIKKDNTPVEEDEVILNRDSRTEIKIGLEIEGKTMRGSQGSKKEILRIIEEGVNQEEEDAEEAEAEISIAQTKKNKFKGNNLNSLHCSLLPWRWKRVKILAKRNNNRPLNNRQKTHLSLDQKIGSQSKTVKFSKVGITKKVNKESIQKKPDRL